MLEDSDDLDDGDENVQLLWQNLLADGVIRSDRRRQHLRHEDNQQGECASLRLLCHDRAVRTNDRVRFVLTSNAMGLHNAHKPLDGNAY